MFEIFDAFASRSLIAARLGRFEKANSAFFNKFALGLRLTAMWSTWSIVIPPAVRQ
jgi:hypothetical protein